MINSIVIQSEQFPSIFSINNSIYVIESATGKKPATPTAKELELHKLNKGEKNNNKSNALSHRRVGSSYFSIYKKYIK